MIVLVKFLEIYERGSIRTNLVVPQKNFGITIFLTWPNLLPMGTNLVGDFGSGGPRGPRGRGVKFRGVIKGHL